jgi:hypothetical protein
MKLIYCLLFLLISCNSKSQETDKIVIQTFKIVESTFEEFKLAQSNFIDIQHYDTIKHQKKNGEIKLPINRKWNPFVIFHDTLLDTDESSIKNYKYIGQFDKIGYYIVVGNFWEHFECYLINKNNGNQIVIWNTPKISQNQQFIANLSIPYGLEGVPNGIQIWKINKNKNNDVEPFSIFKHIEIDQEVWVPLDFVWDNNSIILKVLSIEEYINNSNNIIDKDCKYLKLLIE